MQSDADEPEPDGNTLIQIIWFTTSGVAMSVLVFSVLALLFVSAMASGTEAIIYDTHQQGKSLLR